MSRPGPAVVVGNDWPSVAVAELGDWTPTLTVSVVVPAKGSQAGLDRCLRALGHQTYPAGLMNVVVVDDGSDPALVVPERTGDVAVKVRRHEPHGTFGAGRARNTGAAACDGEILVLLDGDLIVPATFVEAHARWHHAVEFAAVTGVLGFAEFDSLDPDGLSSVIEGDGIEAWVGERVLEGQEWRDRHFERTHDLTAESIDLFRSTIGAVSSVRRSLFEAVGGYREVGVRGVEDTEFGYRLHTHGALLVVDRSARLWHQGRRSFDAGKRAAINEARRPYVEDLIPVPGFRPEKAARRHRVPALAVHVGEGTRDAEAATLASLAAVDDPDVVVVLSADQVATHGERPPAVVAADAIDVVDRAAIPYRMVVRAGATVASDAPAAVLDTLRRGTLGVLHLLGDGDLDGVDVATAWWSRATGRAVALGASGSDETLTMAGACFGERWHRGGGVGIEGTALVAAPAPAESSTPAPDAVAADSGDAAVTEIDVVVLTDTRFPGGTTSSLVEELRAAHAAGYGVGVLHVASPAVGVGTAVNPALRRAFDDGLAISLLPGEAVRARLAIVKHPRIFSRALEGRLPIEADTVLVTVGQVPRDADGTEYYRPATIDAAIREALGVKPVWAPVSPTVRRRLDGVTLSHDDWVEVVDVDEWADSTARRGANPVLGRHGRPDPLKWPDNPDDVLAAYPDDPAMPVRILGAPDELRTMLGGWPQGWEVLPFGSVDVKSYLAGIDFFVYHHHPDLVEAFGRTILEAVASGATVITGNQFEELFGDACLYTDPAGVRPLVERLWADRDAHEEQRARARAVVLERFSHDRHARRLAELVGPPQGLPARRAGARHEAVPPGLGGDRPSVLVSCLGASSDEVADVARALDRHRRHHLGFQPVLATSVPTPAIVDDLGFRVHFVPGPDVWLPSEKDTATTWPEFAQHRLRQLASDCSADSVVPWDTADPYAWIALGTWSRPGAAASARYSDSAMTTTHLGPEGFTATRVDLLRHRPSSLADEIRLAYEDRYGKTPDDPGGWYRAHDWARISYVAGRLRPGGRLLDVGLGAGQFVNLLARSGDYDAVVGADPTRFNKYMELSDIIERHDASIANLPFPDDHFDVVTCMEVLEHVDEDTFTRGLAELRRVCRGQLVMTVPFCEPEPISKSHVRRFVDTDIVELFPRAWATILDRTEGPWVLLEERFDGTVPEPERGSKRGVARPPTAGPTATSSPRDIVRRVRARVGRSAFGESDLGRRIANRIPSR